MGFIDAALAALRGAYFDYRERPDPRQEAPDASIRSELRQAPTRQEVLRNQQRAHEQEQARSMGDAVLGGDLGLAAMHLMGSRGSTNPLWSLLALGGPAMAAGFAAGHELPRPQAPPHIPELLGGVGVADPLMRNFLSRLPSAEPTSELTRHQEMVPQWIVEHQLGKTIAEGSDATRVLKNLGERVILPDGTSAPVKEPVRNVRAGSSWNEAGPIVTNLLNTWFPKAEKNLLHHDEIGQTFRHMGNGKWVFQKTEQEPPIEKPGKQPYGKDMQTVPPTSSQPYWQYPSLKDLTPSEWEEHPLTKMIDSYMESPRLMAPKDDWSRPTFTKPPSDMAKRMAAMRILHPDDMQYFDWMDRTTKEALKDPEVINLLKENPKLVSMLPTDKSTFGMLAYRASEQKPYLALKFRKASDDSPFNPMRIFNHLGHELTHLQDEQGTGNEHTPAFVKKIPRLVDLVEKIANADPYVQQFGRKSLAETFPKGFVDIFGGRHKAPFPQSSGDKNRFAIPDWVNVNNAKRGEEPIAPGPLSKESSSEDLAHYLANGTGAETNRAYRMLDTRHKPQMVGVAMKILNRIDKDKAISTQLASDAMTTLWKEVRKGTPIPDVESWLNKVVHNDALKELARVTKSQRQGDVELNAPVLEGGQQLQVEDVRAPQPEDALATEQTRILMHKALNNIPGKYRTVALAVGFGGLSPTTLALKEGISYEAAAGRIKLAKRQLQLAVKEQGIIPEDMAKAFVTPQFSEDILAGRPTYEKPQDLYPSGPKGGRARRIPKDIRHGDPYGTDLKNPLGPKTKRNK